MNMKKMYIILLNKTARRIEERLIDFVNLIKDPYPDYDNKPIDNNIKELIYDIHNSKFKSLLNINKDFLILKNKSFKTSEFNTIESVTNLSNSNSNTNSSNKIEKKKISLPYRVTLQNGNTRVNKYNQSSEREVNQTPYCFSLSPKRISIMEEKKLNKDIEVKNMLKKFKLNPRNENRMNVRENLKNTAKLVLDYENRKRSPRVYSHLPTKEENNFAKNIFVETNSNLYIKINRNNFGPKLGRL